jgi:hypothetical protein
MKRYGWRRAGVQGLTLSAMVALATALAVESRTSWLQSELFSGIARQLTFHPEPGPGPTVELGARGPYDNRLGYAGLPAMLDRLQERGSP